MTDRYHVIIVDKNQFSMEDYYLTGESEYTLYEMSQRGEELPDGVWFEEWYVEDGAGWESHPMYNHHDLVEEDSYLIDWLEIDKPWMIKDEAWWKEKIKTMEALYEMFKSIYPVADKIIDDVVEILDPDRETLNEAMQGEIFWPDYYTLGHYIWQAKEWTGQLKADENGVLQEDEKEDV